MLDRISLWLGGIPVPGLIAILTLVVAQLVLQITALFDLAKRESVMFDRKWIWVLVIIGGNLVGAIAYWAIGRTEAPVDESKRTTASVSSQSERSQRAVDELYGSEDTQ